jgi:hypothetical protein
MLSNMPQTAFKHAPTLPDRCKTQRVAVIQLGFDCVASPAFEQRNFSAFTHPTKFQQGLRWWRQGCGSIPQGLDLFAIQNSTKDISIFFCSRNPLTRA